MQEIYAPIPGYPEYEASNLGNIRNSITGTVYSQHTTASGYKKVTIKDASNVWRNRFVHKLVLLTFIGEPSGEGQFIDHRDDNKSNNFLGNLQYVSKHENTYKHYYRTLYSSLDRQQMIADYRDRQYSVGELARKYKLSRSAIRQYLIKHVDGYPLHNKRTRFKH